MLFCFCLSSIMIDNYYDFLVFQFFVLPLRRIFILLVSLFLYVIFLSLLLLFSTCHYFILFLSSYFLRHLLNLTFFLLSFFYFVSFFLSLALFSSSSYFFFLHFFGTHYITVLMILVFGE